MSVRSSTLRLHAGGTVCIDRLEDGYDLSVIAPEGVSVAVYISRVELIALSGSLNGITLGPRYKRSVAALIRRHCGC